MTLGAVMRINSLYSADICDLCSFTFTQPKEHDPYHIMILRHGDTNKSKDKIQHGKVMSHMLLEICSICTLGLYSLVRFEIIGEVNTFNLTKNSSWFNQKLLISPLTKKLQEWSKCSNIHFV